MPQDQENQESQNSTVTATADGVTQQPGVQDNKQGDSGTTGSTPAADSPQGTAAGAAADKPKSALDAVQRVLDKGRTTAAATATASTAAEKKEGTTAANDDKVGDEHKQVGEGEKDWISREDYAKLPPAVRRRFGTLTSQRNEARDSLKSAQPKATAYDELATYCKTSGLTPDDFTFGLEVMRLVRTDPAKAWDALQPVIKDLQAHVGEILPTDLQKEVDAGTISEARAKELALARRERQRLTANDEGRVERDRVEGERRAYATRTEKVKGAIEGWENQWKGNDPDYAKKAERVWERMVVLMQGHEHEMTPELAVKIGNQAKKDVEDWLSGLMPRREEKRPLNPSGTTVNTNKRPANALEAARMGLAKTAA